jgi:hypothetical protein
VFLARIGATIVTLLAVLAAGCGQPAGEPKSQSVVEAQSTSYRKASPEQYLAAVFARYRNAASYHDRGIVRLSYREGDRQRSKVAPLGVWLDHYQLYVEAYDVRLGSDPHAMMAWVSDESTEDFDSQVLLLPAIRGRPTVQQLLADPILVQRIAAGLAGPPPQLEWLFSPEPMKQLFHADHEFEFGQSRSVDRRLCHSVRVKAGSDQFQFWIDQQAGIVRRVDLPAITASPEPGEPQQTMALSLELDGASFDEPSGKPDVHPLPAKAKYVRRFIPLPPAEPPRILGSHAASFRLNDSRGQFTLSDRGTDRELTLIIRFSGDERSMASAATIQSWNDRMPDSLGQRVRVVILVDEQAVNRVPRELTLPVVVDQRQAASQSLGLGSGGLAILDSRGIVAWTQPDALPQTIVQLGAVVGDVLDGVDVPRRIRDQWNEQVTQYRRVLSQETVARK